MSTQVESPTIPVPDIPISKRVEDNINFKFHEPLPEDRDTITAATNGLFFNNTYIPEEIVSIVLSHVNVADILKCSLVCRKWCNIIKSHSFWARKYRRKYKKKAKKLPWYVFYCLFSTDYFDVNLIKNGNGQHGFKNWITCWGFHYWERHAFEIEDPPLGSDPLPDGIPEFNGSTSCFATFSGGCSKKQEISFGNNKLMIHVLNKFKPHIYLSEWVAGGLKPSDSYHLRCSVLCEVDPTFNSEVSDVGNFLLIYRNCTQLVTQEHGLLYPREVICDVEGTKWKQVKLIVKDYPTGCVKLIFEHRGYNNFLDQVNYHGIKLAGPVLKILFDTIEERSRRVESRNTVRRKVWNVHFENNNTNIINNYIQSSSLKKKNE